MGNQTSRTSASKTCYSVEQEPLPVSMKRRGGMNIGANPGYAKFEIPVLFVNGKILCTLEEVVDAIKTTKIDESF